MSTTETLPEIIVSEAQLSLQVLLKQFLSEASFRRSEMADFRRQVAALRTGVAELRAGVAGTRDQLVELHIGLRRLASPKNAASSMRR